MEDAALGTPELYQRYFDKFEAIYGEHGVVTPTEDLPDITLPAVEGQEEIVNDGMLCGLELCGNNTQVPQNLQSRCQGKEREI